MNNETLTALDAQAIAILRNNDRGGYTVPTDGLYPYQWNWDSAFAALGFATFDLDRAWQEIETLMAGQWDNGMVPHILFHQIDDDYFPGPDVWGGTGPLPSSGISQPPVAATMVREIWNRDQAGGQKRLAALYPKLVDWHRWFMRWRRERPIDDPNGAGAICITHPWESGRDNAPDWDEAMAGINPQGVAPYTRRDTGHVDPSMRPTKEDYDRYLWLVQLGRESGWDEAKIHATSPFRVADPTMTFVLLRAHRDLADMGRALGQDVGEIEGWITDLDTASATLWNDAIGSYDSRNTQTGRFSGSISNASFLNWYAGIANDKMLAQFDRVLSAAQFGIASLDPDSPKFDSRRYWRGPVWAMMNAITAMGLAEQGHAEQAEQLRQTTQNLIMGSGFSEYFDPTDGAPSGGKSFTWTAAIWLSWVRGYKGETNGQD